MLKDFTQTDMPHPMSASTHDKGLMALDVQMQSPSALLSILSILARLGCDLLQMRSHVTQANFLLRPPTHLRHRVVPCVNELIEVLRVQETESAQNWWTL